MHALKYQTKQGKKYNLLPSHIRGLESVDDGTRIYASVAGIPITFVANRAYDDVEAELEKARQEESEQSA